MSIPFLRASTVALSILAAGPVLAQATGEEDEAVPAVEGEADATVVGGETQVVEAEPVDAVATTEDDGLDLGWLGLLGLLGLAGLGGRRRREETVTRVATQPTVTTQPSVTTHSTVTADPVVTTDPTATGPTTLR